jgi:hypothetical protein
MKNTSFESLTNQQLIYINNIHNSSAVLSESNFCALFRQNGPKISQLFKLSDISEILFVS